MSSNWAVASLSEVVERVTLKNRDLLDRVLTVSATRGLVEQETYFSKRVASSNLSNYLVVHPGTFVYNKSYSEAAPFGVATFNSSSETGVVSPLYFAFKPKEGVIDGRFLEHVLNSAYFHLQLSRFIKQGGRAHGGINVSTSDYFSLKVPVPEPIEQRRIVDLVSSVDTYIDALEHQADSARTVRNAVLDEQLQSTTSSPTKLLKDLTTKIGSGATPRGGEAVYQETGVSLIRSQNVHNGQFIHEGLVAINDFAATALDGVTVAENDVLINITGASVARACIVDSSVLPARVNQHVAILRTDSNQLLPGFLLRVLLGKRINSFLLDISGSGTTRQAITKAQLESVEVFVPTLSEQRRIVDTVSSLDEMIQATDVAVAHAKALRSGLVSDLLSGDHEIPESYDRLLGAA